MVFRRAVWPQGSRLGAILALAVGAGVVFAGVVVGWWSRFRWAVPIAVVLAAGIGAAMVLTTLGGTPSAAEQVVRIRTYPPDGDAPGRAEVAVAVSCRRDADLVTDAGDVLALVPLYFDAEQAKVDRHVLRLDGGRRRYRYRLTPQRLELFHASAALPRRPDDAPRFTRTRADAWRVAGRMRAGWLIRGDRAAAVDPLPGSPAPAEVVFRDTRGLAEVIDDLASPGDPDARMTGRLLDYLIDSGRLEVDATYYVCLDPPSDHPPATAAAGSTRRWDATVIRMP
jgi:hypothetical protein